MTLTLTVFAKIPDETLRGEFNELVAEGYEGSWGDYLAEIEEDFLGRASGWWTRTEIVYGVKRSRKKGA